MGIESDTTIRWSVIRSQAPQILTSFQHWLKYKSHSRDFAGYLLQTDITLLPIELSEGLIKEFLEDSDIFLVDDWTPGGKFSCAVLQKTRNGHLARIHCTNRLKSRRAAMIHGIEEAFLRMGKKISGRRVGEFVKEITVGDGEDH